MATTKNEELQGQSQLTRTVIAALEIKVPAPKDIRFRGSLLRKAITELANTKPQFLVRLFEAAATTDYPDPDVVAFRHALEPHLGRLFNLAEHKAEPASK
jgi:hypothetical protein